MASTEQKASWAQIVAKSEKKPEKKPAKAKPLPEEQLVKLSVPEEFAGVTGRDRAVYSGAMTFMFMLVSVFTAGLPYSFLQTPDGKVTCRVVSKRGWDKTDSWGEACDKLSDAETKHRLKYDSRLVSMIHSQKNVPEKYKRLFKQPSPFQPIPVKLRAKLLEEFFKECLDLDVQTCEPLQQFLIERAKDSLYEFYDLRIQFDGARLKYYA